MTLDDRRSAARSGAAAVVPMLVGVVPFGLVAGAAPVAEDLGIAAAVGLSTVVFAGAAQLAVTDVLADGGSFIVAAVTAWTINVRLLLYSASIAPELAHLPRRRRLAAAYLLTDQAYAVSISRWTTSTDRLSTRWPFYLAAALTLWIPWQISTVVGGVLGNQVPDDVPLDFAVPLVFLVLLVPAVTTRPAAMAAVVGGVGAVTGAELGAGHLSIVVGAVSGIVAGTVAETLRPPAEEPA